MSENNENQNIDVRPEEEEDEVYIEYDIATYPSDFTLSNIHSMWKQKDIKVPTFQRNYVWTIKQASLLIESFLLGLPVPPIFFYIDDETQVRLVIDGQQRIKSVINFFEGYWGEENTQGKRKVFRLTGLDKKSPYHKKNFDDLSAADKRKLENRVLRALNIQQLKPKKGSTSIYHIFERLNTGGTPLKPQEIRNCVFRGQLVDELNDLNKSTAWRKILGKPNFDKHQKDVELIVRLFALSTYSSLVYEKPLKEFLNRVMAKNSNADTKGWIEFRNLFSECCKKIVTSLGEKPFHVRGPLNISVLDSIFCTIINQGNDIPDNFKSKFKSLVKSENFLNVTQIATSDVTVIKKRMEIVKDTLR